MGHWSLNYIDDAATARRSTHRADGSLFTAQASNYDPPANGIHLCGVTDDGLQPTTVAIYPANGEALRRMFEQARAVAECEKDAADFVVDLCVGDEVSEDFWSNRQLWPRAIEAWNAQPQPVSIP